MSCSNISTLLRARYFYQVARYYTAHLGHRYIFSAGGRYRFLLGISLRGGHCCTRLRAATARNLHEASGTTPPPSSNDMREPPRKGMAARRYMRDAPYNIVSPALDYDSPITNAPGLVCYLP